MSAGETTLSEVFLPLMLMKVSSKRKEWSHIFPDTEDPFRSNILYCLLFTENVVGGWATNSLNYLVTILTLLYKHFTSWQTRHTMYIKKHKFTTDSKTFQQMEE